MKTITGTTYLFINSQPDYNRDELVARVNSSLLGKEPLFRSGSRIIVDMPYSSLISKYSVTADKLKEGFSLWGVEGTVIPADYSNTLTPDEYIVALNTATEILTDIGSKLPYTELEYIESTGTQYIDTGILPDDTTLTELTFSFTDNTTVPVILGSRKNWLSQGYFVGVKDDNMSKGYWVQYGSNNSSELSTKPDKLKHTLKFSKTFILDNTQLYQFTNSIGTAYANIALFGAYDGSTTTAKTSAQKVYSCKIYQNDALVRYFIPVKRNIDSVICLYDKVTNTFFENAGTETFIAGGAV